MLFPRHKFRRRRKRFNLFGNYTIRRSNYWVRARQTNGVKDAAGVTHLFESTTVLEMDKARIGQTYRVGLDYYINDKHIVGVLYNGYGAGNELTRQRGQTAISPALNGVASSSLGGQTTDDNGGDQINVNYHGTLAKPAQTLNVDLDWGHFRNSPWQQSKVEYFDAAGLAIASAEEHLRHTNPQDIEVMSAKIDFSTPVWQRAKIEIGAKSARSTTDNDLKYEQQTAGEWSVDAGRTNRFVYTEAIHAAYLNLNQSLGKVNIQAGLRGEYTDSKGDQRTMGKVNRKHFFDLFPTLFVNYSLSQKHSIGASYGRRILRPNYGQLNPFEVKIDAYSFERGNPDLKPSYIDNFALKYSFDQSLMLQLSYDDRKDVITQRPVQEEGRYGLVRTNYGRNRAITAMINYHTAPLKWWRINAMVMARYSRDYSQENSGTIRENSFGVMAQLGNNFTITPTLSAELNGQYQSRFQEAYLMIRPMGNLSCGVRKSFLDGKLSVSLSANDLLSTQRQRGQAVSSAMNYKIDLRRDTRYISIGARWNFGIGNAKAARKRTSGIEDETRRAQ